MHVQRHLPLRFGRAHGFTLIELMVVVVVIAILAAIAIPSYSEAVAKSRRSEAKALLTTLEGELERCFTVNTTYLHSSSLPCPVTQSITGTSSRESENRFYSVSATGGSSVAATRYRLVAVRQGAQRNDRCGDFSLTGTNAKEIENQRSGVMKDDCW